MNKFSIIHFNPMEYMKHYQKTELMDFLERFDIPALKNRKIKRITVVLKQLKKKKYGPTKYFLNEGKEEKILLNEDEIEMFRKAVKKDNEIDENNIDSVYLIVEYAS